MGRIAIAGLVGTTVEFYDFFVFGTAAALVFKDAFFPALGTAAGTLASLATFGVAFYFRPLGSVIFGHFGDRGGRKATLVASLLLMGFATFSIGLLPTADSIGVAAPILLVLLRLCQGIAVGGEWAGAVLLTGEHAPADKRGKYTVFPQLGPSVALALVGGTFLTTSLTMSDEAFAEWGWRIPFLASAVLVLIGLYVRLNIAETPVFANLTATKTVSRVPFFEVARHQTREVLLGAGLVAMLSAFFHVGATYMTSYGTKALGLERTTVLTIGIVSALIAATTTMLSAIYSDRLGRKTVISVTALIAVPWSLALFPILDIGSTWSFVVGTGVTLAIVGAGYGPLGAHLPELFSARYRYTGAGLTFSLGGAFGGAMTPFISEWLLERYSSSAIGFYLTALSLLGLACIVAQRETRGVEMSETADQAVCSVFESGSVISG